MNEILFKKKIKREILLENLLNFIKIPFFIINPELELEITRKKM